MKHTINPFTGDINTWNTSLTEALQKHGFSNGRMISYSKSTYMRANEGHKVYFNSCIYDSNGVQIWYGDLDLTKDSRKLNKVAKESKQEFYVTPESGFRSDFNKITKEQLEKDEWVVKFPKGKK